MNNKNNYKKGKRKELTELILQTGGIPMRDVPLFAKENTATMKQQIYKMLKRGELIAAGRGQNKIVTINYAQERNKIDEGISNKLIQYYENFGQADSYALRSLRADTHFYVLRNSEAFLFMYGAGISTAIEEKESLFRSNTFSQSNYYGCKELKGVADYHTEKDVTTSKITGQTRLNGLVISPGGNYTIYDAYNTMLLVDAGEQHMVQYCNTLLSQKSSSLLKGSIVLFKDYDTIYQYLFSQKQLVKNSQERMFYSYPKVYGLTLDKNGQQLMSIMTQPAWEKTLYEMFLENTKQTGFEEIVNDGKDAEGNYYLVFCSPDLKKLFSFVKGAKYLEDKERCRIICFDFQKEFILKVAGDCCKILTLEFEEYKKEIEKQNEEANV